MSTPPFDPNHNPKAQAKADKAYAKASRPWFKKKRFILPIAAFVLMGIGGALGGSEDEPVETSASVNDEAAAPEAAAADEAVEAEAKPAAKSEATAKAKPKKKTVKAIKVDAGSMLKEFEGNELAGDKKYEGKYVQVTGTIDKIDTELLDSDQYVLRITNGDEFSFLSVNCNDMSEKELSTLTVGDEVTALGKFDDGGDLGVELEKCKLV